MSGSFQDMLDRGVRAQRLLAQAQAAGEMPWPYGGISDRYMQEHGTPSPAVPSHTARLEAEIAELRQHVIRMQTELMALQARVKAVEPKGVMPGAALRHGVP